MLFVTQSELLVLPLQPLPVPSGNNIPLAWEGDIAFLELQFITTPGVCLQLTTNPGMAINNHCFM